MPLTNCRAVRTGTEDAKQIRKILGDYRQQTNYSGNVAFFTVKTSAWMDPGLGNLGGFLDAGGSGDQKFPRTYYIVGHSGDIFGHSEDMCKTLFNSIRFLSRITFVFTEREPCHGAVKDCMSMLAGLLQAYGAQEPGENTPVRYLFPYPNKAELDTMAAMSYTDRYTILNECRKTTRAGLRSFYT